MKSTHFRRTMPVSEMILALGFAPAITILQNNVDEIQAELTASDQAFDRIDNFFTAQDAERSAVTAKDREIYRQSISLYEDHLEAELEKANLRLLEAKSILLSLPMLGKKQVLNNLLEVYEEIIKVLQPWKATPAVALHPDGYSGWIYCGNDNHYFDGLEQAIDILNNLIKQIESDHDTEITG